jgi:cbb3-type cytochrome oxidase subunit 1
MPPLTRWYIRLSLVYFAAALLLGLLLALRPVLDLPERLRAFAPVYLHLFMVGWVTQLIFGVVYWMFPKYSRERPRGSEALAWATFGLINLGLWLRVAAEPMLGEGGRAWGIILGLSAVLQWLAGLAFVINTWGRVKER